MPVDPATGCSGPRILQFRARSDNWAIHLRHLRNSQNVQRVLQRSKTDHFLFHLNASTPKLTLNSLSPSTPIGTFTRVLAAVGLFCIRHRRRHQTQQQVRNPGALNPREEHIPRICLCVAFSRNAEFGNRSGRFPPEPLSPPTYPPPNPPRPVTYTTPTFFSNP